MRKKIKHLIILLSIISIVFFHIISYKTFVKDLHEDKKLFNEQYSNYSLNYFDSQPKKKSDVENMINWSKRTSSFKEYNILNLNNIEVSYNSTTNESNIFYSYGGESKRHTSLPKVTFLKYLFNRYNNILIGSFKKPIFNCAKLSSKQKVPIQALLQNFELFKKEKSLLGSDSIVRKFYKQINSFEKKFNERISKPRKLNVLWFVYKMGKIKVICTDNLSKNKSKQMV